MVFDQEIANSLLDSNFTSYIIASLAIIILVLIAIVLFFNSQINELKNQLNNSKISDDTPNRVKFLEKISKLEQLNSDKDKIFSVISHDLVNYIFSLMIEMDDLSRNHYKLPTDEREDKIDELNQYTKNLHSILDNILKWVKSQENRIKINFDILEVKPLVDQIIDFYEIPGKLKKIRIINSISSTSLIYGDKNLIDTILRNLINNAIKFTPEGGKIEFNFEISKDFDKLSISDSGIGMNSDQQMLLFDDKKEFSTKGTKNEKGSGIGFILIQEFMNMHKGKIEVESVPNKGTTFHLNFPKAPFRKST